MPFSLKVFWFYVSFQTGNNYAVLLVYKCRFCSAVTAFKTKFSLVKCLRSGSTAWQNQKRNICWKLFLNCINERCEASLPKVVLLLVLNLSPQQDHSLKSKAKSYPQIQNQSMEKSSQAWTWCAIDYIRSRALSSRQDRFRLFVKIILPHLFFFFLHQHLHSWCARPGLILFFCFFEWSSFLCLRISLN